MKTLAASLATLVYLCAPALADSSPPPAAPAPDWLKVRFALHDAVNQTFDVAIGSTSPCATVSQKAASREVELSACAAGDGRLDISWRIHITGSEYHSRSSIPATRGATTQLGAAPGPRLEVTVQ